MAITAPARLLHNRRLASVHPGRRA